jgi:peptide/nickel transport system substrate-binding protein
LPAPILRRAAAGAFSAVVVAIAACSKVGTVTHQPLGSSRTLPGIVRLGIVTEPDTLNPVTSGLTQEGYVEAAIFDGLTMLDGHGDVVADLATVVPSRANGGISPDGRTITYHLRRGVRWQDGAPLTSADVAFTYRAYTNPKVNSFYTTTYQHIAWVATPDPYTVVLHLRAPFAPAFVQFFERGTGGFVLPRHILEHAADLNTDPFGKHPVGSGPYRLARWDHGSHIVLEANAGYFAGAPHVRTVDVRIVGNPNTQLEMVLSGELDVASQLVPSQYRELQHLHGSRALLVPSLFERFLTFNLRRPPFDDVRVRRALALALDRPRIVATAYSGTSTLAQTLIPPWNWAYDPAGAPGYDPQRAEALLDAAGWVTGRNGIRTKNGRRLAFSLVTQSESNPLSEMAQEMQRAWRRIGADVSIVAVTRNVIYGNPGLATDGKFDALIDDWGADPDPDRGVLIETKNFEPHGYNDAFYSDPDVDRWSEEALATYDRARRKILYAKIQRRLNRDLPYVPLAWEGRIYALNNDLRGFVPEPIWSDFWNAQNWRI